MASLSGSVAWVTGASKGIGKGIALAFASKGASLLLTARNAAALADTAEVLRQSGTNVETLAGDVADPEHVQACVRLIQHRFGQLDLLVNNAGAFEGGALDELSLADWDRVIATNLRGPFLCTQAAIRLMKPNRRGRIINIGSISAQRVRPGSAAYSTSKHGIWGLTQVTALEGREYGITCGCLHPGNIAVERRSDTDKVEDREPMMSVADIAEVAVLMATLPPHVEMLEAIVLPAQQLYVGRG